MGRRRPSPARALPLATVLLALVALAALWAASASAEPEVEPNDSPLRGNDFHSYHAEDTSIHYYPVEGTCDYSPDFINLHPFAGTGFTVTYNLTDKDGGPGEDHLELLSPAGAPIAKVDAEGGGTLQGAAITSGEYSVSIDCGGSATNWTLELEMSSVPGPWRGPGETEYNNYGPNASYLSGQEARGAVSVPFDVVDMWRLSPSSPDVTIQVLPEGSLDAQLATVGPDGEIITWGEGNLTLRSPAQNGLLFAVVARGGGGFYNVTVTPAAAGTASGAGPDEPAPNDAYGDATAITVSDGLEVDGTARFDGDPIDWYTFTMPYPARLNLTISSAAACEPHRCEHLTLLDQDRRLVIDPLGSTLDGSDGYHLAAPEGLTYYLRVDAGYPGGDYSIHFDAPRYPYQAGDTVELVGANESQVVASFATGVELEVPIRNFNIALFGNGVMYGECITFLVLNRAPVALNLEIRAGTRIVPQDPQLARFVVTRNTTLQMSPWNMGELKVYASMESSSGYLPSYGHLYFIDGPSTGNQALVANETGDGAYSPAAEISAIWSANGVSHATLREYGASEAALSEARTILQRAGVVTDLAPAPSQGGAGGGSSSGLAASMGALAPWLGLGVVLLLALGWAVGRRRPSGDRGHPSAPLFPDAVAGPPPSPPTSPPTSPPASPPAPAPLQTARAVGPAPAAPVEEVGTAPCPRCGKPVAFYTPACPSCQMALEW